MTLVNKNTFIFVHFYIDLNLFKQTERGKISQEFQDEEISRKKTFEIIQI